MAIEKNMSERDLLIELLTKMETVTQMASDHARRIYELEMQIVQFKAQIRTAIAIATALGSFLSFIVQHFISK